MATEYIREEDDEFPATRALDEPEMFGFTPRRSFTDPERLVDGEGERRREEEGIGERERWVEVVELDDEDDCKRLSKFFVALLYISATCSGEMIPAGKSNRERIFDVVSCCRNNCFFNSYADVLDFFDGGSHEDVERFPSETLPLDGGKGSDHDGTLF